MAITIEKLDKKVDLLIDLVANLHHINEVGELKKLWMVKLSTWQR